MVIDMTKWIPIVCVAMAITFYRMNVGEPGIIMSAIMGAIGGGIGGVIMALIDRYLKSRDNYGSIKILAYTAIWFVLYCFPGLILGSIVSIDVNNTTYKTLIIILCCIAISGLLTIRKYRKDKKTETGIFHVNKEGHFS